MNNLISRQAAIEGLKKTLLFRLNPELAERVRHYLESVPAANDWIPFRQEQDSDTGLWEWCEPLPKENQHILVTIAIEGHEPVQDDYWYTDGSGCYLDSGYDIGTEAVAWMPLPEPYKEDTRS